MHAALRSRHSGFTLIEILVVVAVIAAVASILVLAASPSDATRARNEARRLATLLELAIAERKSTPSRASRSMLGLVFRSCP